MFLLLIYSLYYPEYFNGRLSWIYRTVKRSREPHRPGYLNTLKYVSENIQSEKQATLKWNLDSYSTGAA